MIARDQALLDVLRRQQQLIDRFAYDDGPTSQRLADQLREEIDVLETSLQSQTVSR